MKSDRIMELSSHSISHGDICRITARFEIVLPPYIDMERERERERERAREIVIYPPIRNAQSLLHPLASITTHQAALKRLKVKKC